MAAAPPFFRRLRPAPGKRGFAKRARGFVNRVAALPGFPHLWVAMAAASGLMIVTGGFNTGLMPLPQRSLFWLLLFGWSLAKWQLWFACTVRAPQDWLRSALIGAVLLNLLLPLEVPLALAAVGVDARPGAIETLARALVISALVSATVYAAKRWVARPATPVAAGVDSPLLARAGVAIESLAAVEAEDHYCRVRRCDGSSALVHYRFGDALAEMGQVDGLQVHRGAWVAARAVRGAVRDGRRWQLRLSDGTGIAVSATRLAAVRARGWLHPPTA